MCTECSGKFFENASLFVGMHKWVRDAENFQAYVRIFAAAASIRTPTLYSYFYPSPLNCVLQMAAQVEVSRSEFG